MKKKWILGCVVLVICLFCLVGVRSITGWRPYRNLESDDLYYVSYLYAFKPGFVFLEEDELEEFAELMRELRVYPTSYDLSELGGGPVGFIFERKDRKGEMIWGGAFPMATLEGEGYYYTENNDLYRIDPEFYERFEAFVSRWK